MMRGKRAALMVGATRRMLAVPRQERLFFARRILLVMIYFYTSTTTCANAFTVLVKPTVVGISVALLPEIPSLSSSSSSRLFLSASLEEGEDLLYYGATTAPNKRKQQDDDPNKNKPRPSKVRRDYETWNWEYQNATYKINYRVEGKVDAPPLLLVHGFGANVNHFRHQFNDRDLTSNYRVYAIDLLGFGASDKPLNAATVGFSIELFVQQIQDFLGNFKHEQPWVLAGNSIGGLCCLGVAAAASEKQNKDDDDKNNNNNKNDSCIRIDSVILFNTSGGMTGFRYEYVPFWARPLMGFVQHVVLGPTLGGYFFRNFKSRENIRRILLESGVYGDTTRVDDELLEILLEPADDTGAEQVFLAVFGGPAGPTPEEYLQRITNIPVYALWGAQDPWTPVDAGMHPGNKLGDAAAGEFTLCVLPGTGHCPHDECPEVVNAKMLEFLQQHRQQQQQQQQEKR